MNLGPCARMAALLGALASCMEGISSGPADASGAGGASYTLTLQTTGNGSTNPATGVTSYPRGKVLEIAATPAAGATFTGWSGSATGNANPLALTMDGNKTLTANFSGGSAAQYTLTIATAGSGTTSPAAGTYSYDAGASVAVTATPGSDATFTGWSGALSSADNPATVVMNGNKVLTANFSSGTSTRYTLTIQVSGSGSTDPAAGAHIYDSGAKVTVKATPAAGATFTAWGGAASGTASSVSITMDSNKTLTAGFSAAQTPTTYSNPVLWEDLADADVFRVDDTFYYMASNMHYSPGAPILRSYDLVNWEFAGHAVPVLDFGPAFDLNGGRAYIRGTWASAINYRKSNKTFYFAALIQGGNDVMYTASEVEGPWVKHSIQGGSGYYDAGLLIDDDDTLYVSHGTTNIAVAQLSADGFSQVKKQVVYSGSEYIEGSRFYKRDGKYYILVTRPSNAEYVLRSTGGPWGPYEKRTLVDGVSPPISGAGNPHQGGLVQTQKDNWYYMAFVDNYPGGRTPVLAPVQWSTDGWPTVELVNQAWSASYPFPDVPVAPRAMKSPTGVDTFSGTALSPEWEWNHNPDNTKWSVNDGLTLQTATVTDDLYSARNTLTHRILGPSSTATIALDYSNMKDGDRAGLVILRHLSAWIGVKRDGGATKVSMVSGLTMDGNWNTTGKGSDVASATVSGGKIWLRAAADIRPGAGRQVNFSYSTDGATFTSLGTPFTLNNDWQFFMGYRFGIFNYATQSLGGSVSVASFELATP